MVHHCQTFRMINQYNINYYLLMKTAYKSIYKVRKGDTLEIIGKVLEVNWLFIYHLNKVKIGPNPKIIQIGQ